LRGDGRTIILCTHNLPEAEELADRIAIIRRGQIIAQGTAMELKAELLGLPLIELRLNQHLDGILENLSDLVEVESHGSTWLRYRTGQPEVINPQIVQRLVARELQVVSLSEVTRGLEDVYLRVVQSDDAT
jgi:ABC-2 type transport system ATP-binding protein